MSESSQSRVESVAEYVEHTLPAILRLLQSSDVHELVLQEGDIRLRLHRSSLPAAGAPHEVSGLLETSSATEPESCFVTAPLVGTFHRSGQEQMPPLVTEGSSVDEDTVIGIIDALHVLTEVEAGCRGVVTRVVAGEGEPVEYGQSLLEVRLGG